MKKFAAVSIYFLLFSHFLSGQITYQVPEDYSSIQDAINASESGDSIIVSEGIYYENISFRGKRATASTFGDGSRG